MDISQKQQWLKSCKSGELKSRPSSCSQLLLLPPPSRTNTNISTCYQIILFNVYLPSFLLFLFVCFAICILIKLDHWWCSMMVTLYFCQIEIVILQENWFFKLHNNTKKNPKNRGALWYILFCQHIYTLPILTPPVSLFLRKTYKRILSESQ